MDYSSSKALQVFLSFVTSEGKIDEETYFYLFGNSSLSISEQYEMLYRHYRNFYGMLSMLTLYDEVVIAPVKNLPLIDEMLLDELGIHYTHAEEEKSWIGKILKKNKSITAEEAESVIRKHKEEILSDFAQEKCFAEYWTDYDFNLSDSFEYYLERYYHLDILPSSKLSSRLSAQFEFDILGRSPQNFLKTGEYVFMDYLDATFKSLGNSMKNQNGTFYSSLLTPNNWNIVAAEDCEEVDNLVVAADFSGGIGVVPHPETIQDVIKWRKFPELKSFRAVFSEWVHTMRNGDFDLASKMQLDVREANKQLLKLEKYDNLNKNVMVAFWKFAFSKIPGIDVLIAASDFLTPYITDYQKSKNTWVNLPAFNPNSPPFETLKRRKNKTE